MLTVFTWLAVIVTIAFIGVMWIRREQISKWGRYILILFAWGLFICCLVATRDGYDQSVQNMIDGNVAAGLFSVQSIQSNICCILGGLIFW